MLHPIGKVKRKMLDDAFWEYMITALINDMKEARNGVHQGFPAILRNILGNNWW
jgi:hypothetical protein